MQRLVLGRYVEEGKMQLKNRALFLDRDGVINEDRGYVARKEDFKFLPGIFELVGLSIELGLLPIVVTNQSAIGRGWTTEESYADLTKWIHEQFSAMGAPLAGIYHCPYHPTEALARYRQDSNDRKPNPGMLLKAASDFQLDLGTSYLVGDRDTDISAGRRAGVGTCILLGKVSGAEEADWRVADLFECKELLFTLIKTQHSQ